MEDIDAGHCAAGPGGVGIIPVLRGRPGAGLTTRRSRALVGSGSPHRRYFSRAVGAAQVDVGAQSRLWNDHALPVAHGLGSLLLQRREHGAWIMPTRSARTTRLTSTDQTEVGIIRRAA